MNTHRRTTTSRALAVAAAAALALSAAACADGEQPPAADPATEGTPVDGDPDDDAPDDPADNGTEPEPTDEAQDDGTHAGVLAAIDLAESETGGTAFEVDDADGGNWEVYIASGDDEIEVLVSGDGTTVLESDREGSLDAHVRDALTAAAITISDAIRIAAEHGSGLVDDVNLDPEGDTFAWEVTFEDDTEVYIDVATGDVIRVE